jgi:hypothetical protein
LAAVVVVVAFDELFVPLGVVGVPPAPFAPDAFEPTTGVVVVVDVLVGVVLAALLKSAFAVDSSCWAAAFSLW